MIDKFEKYYQVNELFNKADKILLTVSGGKDSMTMLHLFRSANLFFEVAHCNFKLRGEEANKDEAFIRQYCTNNNIEFHSVAFNTNENAQENGVSIQMAARDLRYTWFEEIRKENNFNFIATAHHKNDIAETMLINLTKGTGIAGLHVIRNKRDSIIRPLLCFDSVEIDSYVKENEIQFRQDQSNSDTKYTRNSIRHNVIPELEKINPSFIETVVTASVQFSELEEIVSQKIEEEKRQLFVQDGEGFKIDINLLKELSPLKTYLYYFLKVFNFNAADVSDVINGFEGQSGQVFYSSSHQIVKDRTHLLLNKIVKVETEELEIHSIKDFPFDCDIVNITSDFKIEKSSSFAYLDADKVKFPMRLRTWTEGDFFRPLGMKGNKKVSDFLIDQKVSVVAKKTVKVLVQAEEIVWLVGHRISDKYSVSSSTKRVLKLSI